MASIGEIEYLEEDAEIVQQCVQLNSLHFDLSQSKTRPVEVLKPTHVNYIPVREAKKNIRKKTNYDSDSSYEPPKKPVYTYNAAKTYASKNRESSSFTAKQSLLQRKKLNIRIPDFDDPLCLPVRAIKSSNNDIKRLDSWNKVCLDHLKNCNVTLKPEKGETKKSVRMAIFKNVINKENGNTETTLWSKTSVENEEGDKKSEIFQSVLPKYKEKKVLNNYLLGTRKLKYSRTIDEVLLSKEDNKDGEKLVVYKPKESCTAVYTLIDKRKQNDELKMVASEAKMCMKELTCAKICAPCFQASWRGVKTTGTRSLVCPICGRSFGTAYNLVAHFKTHNASEIRAYGRVISAILFKVIPYHYKCRICRVKFDTIKKLRKHVKSHQSAECFKCEVCNEMINV